MKASTDDAGSGRDEPAEPGHPGVDALLMGRGDEHSLAGFLAARGAQSHLVAPRAVMESLPATGAGSFTWSQTLDEVPATARTLYIDSANDELGMLQAARERFPERRVLGLRHHLTPMLATDRQPLKDVPDRFKPDSLERYVIVCPARSGSTLLGQLLTQAGIGRPKEHLRNPVAAALRSPGVDRREIWRQVAWRARVDGIFGSKLVCEFLSIASNGAPFGELLDTLAPEGVKVIALRRPLVSTTVSRVVARQADQWHVRGGMSDDERQRFSATRYDFQTLRTVMLRNRAENQTLQTCVERLDPERVLDVEYAELDAHPKRTLERVAAFLGQRADMRGLKPERLPIKISGEVDTHSRMVDRFLADLQAHGDDVDANTFC